VRFLRPKTEMTTGEFNAALREAGFGVRQGRIGDVSGMAASNWRSGTLITMPSDVRERLIKIGGA
jgi:hypothetical protein